MADEQEAEYMKMPTALEILSDLDETSLEDLAEDINQVWSNCGIGVFKRAEEALKSEKCFRIVKKLYEIGKDIKDRQDRPGMSFSNISKHFNIRKDKLPHLMDLLIMGNLVGCYTFVGGRSELEEAYAANYFIKDFGIEQVGLILKDKEAIKQNVIRYFKWSMNPHNRNPMDYILSEVEKIFENK